MPVSVSKSPVTSQEMPELFRVFTSPTSPMKRLARMSGADQNFDPRCQNTAPHNASLKGLLLCATFHHSPNRSVPADLEQPLIPSQSTQLSLQNSPPHYDSLSYRYRLEKLSWEMQLVAFTQCPQAKQKPKNALGSPGQTCYTFIFINSKQPRPNYGH